MLPRQFSNQDNCAAHATTTGPEIAWQFELHGLTPAALIAGMAMGAIYGFIPGILKATSGAHEVVTTIMLNVIAAYIVAAMVAVTMGCRVAWLVAAFAMPSLVETAAAAPAITAASL